MNTIRAPWTLGTHDPRIVVYNAHGDEVVTVHGHYDDTVSVARLIAAAPDLLAVAKKLDALQRQFEFYSMGNKMPGNDLYSGLLMEIVTDARAAIAAAKGEK